MTTADELNQNEEIEGADDSFVGPQYPLDNVFVQRDTKSIFEVVRRINQNGYIMNPEFQRDFVWTRRMQSRLIESVLMRVPLPVFYLAENSDGRLVVVDGLQRLSTFWRYLNGEFALDLDRAELNGKKFGDLHPKLANRIEDTNLVFYIIDSKVPERIRLDIFERVNSGVPLTRQQMRNCIYMGKATRWLKEQAESALFRTVTGGKLKSSTMQDREAVNRFCAFALCYPHDYSEEIDEFLARALQDMNTLSDEDLKDLGGWFQRSLHNNQIVFGKHAFRKQSKDDNKRRPFNMSLFDVFSVEMMNYDSKLIELHKHQIAQAFLKLLEDGDFVLSISNATATKSRVVTRFSKVRTMLDTVMHAHTD